MSGTNGSPHSRNGLPSIGEACFLCGWPVLDELAVTMSSITEDGGYELYVCRNCYESCGSSVDKTIMKILDQQREEQ